MKSQTRMSSIAVKRSAVSLRAFVALCAGLCLLALLAPLGGCGGSGSGKSASGPPSRATGNMSVTIAWPHPTRAIPRVADQIKLTFSSGANSIMVTSPTATSIPVVGPPVTAPIATEDNGSAVRITRPNVTPPGTPGSTGDQTTLNVTVPAGIVLTVTADAYRSDDPSVSLAHATDSATVAESGSATLIFALKSTVKSLTLAPIVAGDTPDSNGNYKVGASAFFKVTAKNAVKGGGATVMVDKDGFSFSLDGGNTVAQQSDKAQAKVTFNKSTYQGGNAIASLPSLKATFSEGSAANMPRDDVSVTSGNAMGDEGDPVSFKIIPLLTDPTVASSDLVSGGSQDGFLKQSGTRSGEKATATLKVRLKGANAINDPSDVVVTVLKGATQVTGLISSAGSPTQIGTTDEYEYSFTFTAPKFTAATGAGNAGDYTIKFEPKDTYTASMTEAPLVEKSVTVKVATVKVTTPVAKKGMTVVTSLDQRDSVTLSASLEGIKADNKVTFKLEKSNTAPPAAALRDITSATDGGTNLLTSNGDDDSATFNAPVGTFTHLISLVTYTFDAASSYTITAKATDYPSVVSGALTLTVNDITVTINSGPTGNKLTKSTTFAFGVTVIGVKNPAVTWLTATGGGTPANSNPGSISNTIPDVGKYTAPPTTGWVKVTVNSDDDNSKSDSKAFEIVP